MANPPQTILLVEDNEDDAFITQRAFAQAGVEASMHRCEDGQEVIDYLSGTGRYVDRTLYPLPDIILLDLKLPRKTGLEVLRWIRENDKFTPLLVLALTSSSEKQDVETAYRLHVNAYVVKPTSVNSMVEIARNIRLFWLDHANVLRPILLTGTLAALRPLMP